MSSSPLAGGAAGDLPHGEHVRRPLVTRTAAHRVKKGGSREILIATAAAKSSTPHSCNVDHAAGGKNRLGIGHGWSKPSGLEVRPGRFGADIDNRSSCRTHWRCPRRRRCRASTPVMDTVSRKLSRRTGAHAGVWHRRGADERRVCRLRVIERVWLQPTGDLTSAGQVMDARTDRMVGIPAAHV